MLKVGTDCSGIGAPEEALAELQVKHEIVFACDKDKFARETYLANHKPGVMFKDMTTRDNTPAELYADLYIAGIPCQAFSIAGKRLGELDPRGLLFYNFYDYVKKRRPKVFIIENVKGLLSHNEGRTFNNWLQLLGGSVNGNINVFNHPDSLEYNLHYKVLNTLDYGLPQSRERVFLIGIRPDLPNEYNFPTPVPLEKDLKDILEQEVDERYYLSDEQFAKLSYNGEKPLPGQPKIVVNSNGELKQRELFNCLDANYHKGIDNHQQRSHVLVAHACRTEEAKAVRRQHAAMGKKDYSPHSMKEIKFVPQNYMNTITCAVTKDCLIKVAPHYRVRKLTPLECFRLQGFRDDFIKPCSDTQLYKQAGNTITTKVIKAVLKNLKVIIK